LIVGPDEGLTPGCETELDGLTALCQPGAKGLEISGILLYVFGMVLMMAKGAVAAVVVTAPEGAEIKQP
jgi:hypothetical protein